MPHYAIFHQHLNMYNLINLKNLFKLANLKIEKVFKNKSAIFCSVINKNSLSKIHKFDYKNKIKILRKNLLKQAKIVRTKLKENYFNIYGAGGSASLYLANHKFITKKILNIYDSQNRKVSKIFPGTKVSIKKTYLDHKFPSISFYKIDKKNNLFINQI